MILALGTPLPSTVKPWKHFEVDAIIVSSYYIVKNRCLRERIYRRGIKEVLDFDGMVILDSGAFQSLRKGECITIRELEQVYKETEDAEIKLSLDWPNEKVIENYEKLKHLNVLPILPACRMQYIRYFEKEACEWIFVGRLAKMLMRYGRNGLNLLEGSLSKLKERTSKSIWAMGIGNYTTLPVLQRCGVEGADTSSYRVAAAYGDILLPWSGTHHITGRKRTKKRWGMKMVDKLDILPYLDVLGFSFEDLVNSFEKRVMFNAYILTGIIKKRAEINVRANHSFSY